MFKYMPTLNFLTVSETEVICLASLTLTQQYYQDVQLEVLPHHLKFHPDQMKSVGENEAIRFYFALTWCPQDKVKISDSGIKW